MPKRQGNNPKRRIVLRGTLDSKDLHHLASEVFYLGSPHHKRNPADYGFQPPVSPRPHKPLCDVKRVVKQEEAETFFRESINRGLVSTHSESRFPKYVWAVDGNGEAYEAKLGHDGHSYHGYRLGDDDQAMQQWVIEEWKIRDDPN